MKIEKNRIEIRVYGPSDDQEISICLPWDAGLDEWRSAFKAILINQTFAEDTVKDFFFDEGSHNYREDNSSEYSYPCGMNDSTRDKAESNYANAY